MACCLKNGFSVCGFCEGISVNTRTKSSSGVVSSFGAGVQFAADSRSKDFLGKPLNVSDLKGFSSWTVKTSKPLSVNAQSSYYVSRALRWWEKTLKPNMIDIQSAQELVDTLSNAGDRLVIIDFYSPGCGGCRALHPKICQLAESNQNAIFLKVNYEEHRAMCHVLNIHVVPFFRFYRGAEGKLCSFSCTNATIKKFKDALAKYGTERCNVGAAKGLEESELVALSSNGNFSRKLPKQPSVVDIEEDLVLSLDKSDDKIGLRGGNELLFA